MIQLLLCSKLLFIPCLDCDCFPMTISSPTGWLAIGKWQYMSVPSTRHLRPPKLGTVPPSLAKFRGPTRRHQPSSPVFSDMSEKDRDPSGTLATADSTCQKLRILSLDPPNKLMESYQIRVGLVRRKLGKSQGRLHKAGRNSLTTQPV
jgi:hypothetical protein